MTVHDQVESAFTIAGIRSETADIEIRPLPLCSLPQSHGRQLRDEYLC
jgi:hypothetical protein